MKIEIAEHSRMSESGSSLLRLIQNQSIPLLDLLVRESIQNSLDAKKDDASYVDVNLIVGEFQNKALSNNLDKISSALNLRYGDQKYKYIAVRDSNTEGLTGAVRDRDVVGNNFGNLLKLVYEICKPQTAEGAGGSWGLGKTIYFRLGIGLVFYYSRINERGYHSRLSACLVEDETKTDAMIPQSSGVKRGIAWWGKRDGRNRTVPCDAISDIHGILDVFGLKPYEGKETGTTIIIPYIDEQALLDEVYARNEAPEQKPFWVSSIPEYFKVAIQRWYAPRLFNTAYPYGPYLSARVDGEKLRVSDMLSTFRCIREMYILSSGAELEDDSLIKTGNVDVQTESIDLRGVLNTTSAGIFTYAKFSRSQLYMDPPNNEKTPYQQISNISVQMDNGNGPVIMYTRRPGMIVGYDYDGQWTHRMPHAGQDDYIIGLFVANSANSLKNIIDQRSGQNMSLEEYIRQGEKADHASWSDRNIGGNNPRIISSVQKNIINKIKRQYNEVVRETPEKQNIGLGHALANLLLPSDNFGSAPTPPPNPPVPPVPPKPRPNLKSAFHITGQPKYEANQITVDFEMTLRRKKSQLALQILTDFRHFEADTWESEDELGVAFPMEFTSFKVDTIQEIPKKKSNLHLSDVLINTNTIKAEDDYITVEMLHSSVFGKAGYISVSPHLEKSIVTGSLSFRFTDPGLKGGLDLKEIE